MMSNAKKLLPYLALSLALTLGGGGAVLAANAEEEEKTKVGQHIFEMTDLNGEVCSLPVWYDGSEYLLADYTRNIFVHNGFEARGLEDVVAGVDRFPVYSSKDGKFTDGSAISLYSNAIKAYDFYSKENIGEDYHGFNGKNDDIAGNWNENTLEIPLHAFVHVNSGGFRFNAACFSEKGMTFLVAGDGDKSNYQYDMYQQAACIDVIAHEFQHGIAKHLNKGLTYEGDSGALDEAFADIFGMLVSGEDMASEKFWEIGEDCTISGNANRRIDYPLKSAAAGYRENIRSKHVCNMHPRGGHPTSCDNNYVHYNSTIVSHVQFTAWQIAPEVFTRQATGTLWFNTLKKLGPDATFNDFSTAIRKTAEECLPKEGKAAIDYSLYVNGFISTVMHKVTFVDDEDNVLFTMAVEHGKGIDEIPTQMKDSEFYDYTFQSWDQDLSFVTDDITVKAVFEKTPKNFTVRFVLDDGTLFEEKIIPYGDFLEFPLNDPQKAADEDYEYRFAGWDGVKEKVEGDMTVTALFDKTEIEKKVPPSFPPGAIIGIACGGVALIGVVVAVVIVKKKKS